MTWLRSGWNIWCTILRYTFLWSTIYKIDYRTTWLCGGRQNCFTYFHAICMHYNISWGAQSFHILSCNLLFVKLTVIWNCCMVAKIHAVQLFHIPSNDLHNIMVASQSVHIHCRHTILAHLFFRDFSFPSLFSYSPRLSLSCIYHISQEVEVWKKAYKTKLLGELISDNLW